MTALAAGILACSPAAKPGHATAPAPAVAAKPAWKPALGPARYAVPWPAGFLERTGGVDRLLLDGRRVEARGTDVLAVVTGDPELNNGWPLPAWAATPNAAVRYAFWHDSSLFGAADFKAVLRPLGELPAPLPQPFDWLDGVGLSTNAGLFVVRPDGAAPLRLDLPGATLALAADARRALVLTVFGHARLTLDGGATYRDVSADLPEATLITARGDDLVALLHGGEPRIIDPQGNIHARAAAGPERHEVPHDLEDRWPENTMGYPLEAAASSGVLLPDGDALVSMDDNRLARVDLRLGRATEILELPVSEGKCTPFRAPEGPLALCQGEERASVVDLRGVPHLERSFDIEGKAAEEDARYVPGWDRFVGTDGEALGFLGPCSGKIPPSPADVVSGASPTNASNQRSPVFCVRAGPGSWVEHKLEPVDGTDVIAWVPRSNGGAVAIVALPGTFSGRVPRIEERGPLRVVRLSRNEPPLDVSTWGNGTPALLARNLHARADGSIEGFLQSAHGPSGLASITIDAEGRASQHPLPARTSELSTAGRYALVRTEDERLFESTDRGLNWIEVPRPRTGDVSLSTCSEVGCRVGSFVRIGWGAPPGEKPQPPRVQRPDYNRPLPAPPIVHLSCHFNGQADTKRMPESFGLGFTKTPMPRMAPGKIGGTGALMIPWTGPQMVMSGDAEIAYLPLFDLSTPIKRATVPLSRLGPTPFHPFEVRLGYLLDEKGAVRPVVTYSFGRCAAPLVDEAGLTLPIGGCADDPTVGVLLGGRALLLHHGNGSQSVSVVDLPEDKGGRRGDRAPVTPGARRELWRRDLPSEGREFTMGAGLRKGAPVAIAIDASGEAVLAAVDPERGTFGAEEHIAPLAELLPANDPRCAARPDDTRVVLPFDTEIGLAPGALPGVTATGSAGVAVLRWSSARVCLEQAEIAVRDERYEPEVGYYDPPGTVRKLLVRFDGARGPGRATLAVMLYGAEIRQPVLCDGIAR
jgi:hypothetical protein